MKESGTIKPSTIKRSELCNRIRQFNIDNGTIGYSLDSPAGAKQIELCLSCPERVCHLDDRKRYRKSTHSWGDTVTADNAW